MHSSSKGPLHPADPELGDGYPMQQSCQASSSERTEIQDAVDAVRPEHNPDQGQKEPAKSDEAQWKPTPRFWTVMLALIITNILSSLENTIIVIALPHIVHDIGGSKDYIWISSIHFLTGVVALPLLGQLANLFGRRFLIIGVVAVYSIGCGLCGGASSSAMMIVGRAIQGFGGSGLTLMTEIIIADLVPVRLRAQYLGGLMGISGIAAMVGPTIGGLFVEYSTWRWVFYFNLPICGVAIVMLFIFLRVRRPQTGETAIGRLRRLDLVGNIIIMGASTSVLLALTWAGPVYSWSSAQIIAPLVVGLLGVIAFFLYQYTWHFTSVDPLLPRQVFQEHPRTAIVVFINVFIVSAVMYWASFLLPVYFQAVRGQTPVEASVSVLPVSLFVLPSLAAGAVVLTKTGRWKAVHLCGFALMTLGCGMLSLFQKDDSKAKYICVQIPVALGLGAILTTQLTVFQGCAREKDQAAATAAYTWIRAMGLAWGVAIGGAVFNQATVDGSRSIDDVSVRALFGHGDAFALATREFVLSIPEPVRSQVQSVFESSLHRVFWACTGVAGMGFLLVWVGSDIPLRTENTGEYGLEGQDKK